MSDKTCGTCICGQRPSVWCSCSDEIKPANRPACGDYFERAESVEQVARNMLDALRANCDFTAWRIYRDRLRALGVVE